MKNVVLPLAACGLLLCGCPKKQAVQDPAREPLTEAQPAATPAPFPEQPAAQPETPPAPPPAQAQPVRPLSGWRVQLFASGTRENARKVAEEARWKFPEQQLFIFEQGGLHKVQLGNGLDRAQADQLRQRAKDEGFSGAFAVEVTF